MRSNLYEDYKFLNDHLDSAKNYYKSIGNPSFDGVIRDLIEIFGIESVCDSFEIHAKLYEKINGLSENEKQKTHDKYFNNADITDTYNDIIAKLRDQLDENNPEEVNSEFKKMNKQQAPKKRLIFFYGLLFVISSIFLAKFFLDGLSILGPVGILFYFILFGYILSEKDK